MAAFDHSLIGRPNSGSCQAPKLLVGMVKLRNSFAHPKEFNSIWNPAMAVTILQSTIEIVNHLWP